MFGVVDGYRKSKPEFLAKTLEGRFIYQID